MKLKLFILALLTALVSMFFVTSSASAVHNHGTQIGTSTSTAAGSGTIGFRYKNGIDEWVVIQLERGETSCCYSNNNIWIYVPLNKDVAISYREGAWAREVKTESGWHRILGVFDPQHITARECLPGAC